MPQERPAKVAERFFDAIQILINGGRSLPWIFYELESISLLRTNCLQLYWCGNPIHYQQILHCD